MIVIEYTHSSVEGEPGPNLYWRGKPEDYLKLLNDLHHLGKQVGVELVINQLAYIKVKTDHVIEVKSSNDGEVLLKKEDKLLTMNLTPRLWRDVLFHMLGISFYPSHAYVDFDDLDLIEDANIIMSSEG